jgi:hypothetical protein
MNVLELHYGRAKLIRLSLLALVATALMLWVATGGIPAGEETRGRGAWLGRMLGPDGLQILGWVLAAVTASFSLLSIRRAFGDLLAARADASMLTIYTIFGSHHYAARDIDAIEIRRPAGQGILQIVPVQGRGKQRGLTLNSLKQDEGEIGQWIEAVHAAQAPTRG